MISPKTPSPRISTGYNRQLLLEFTNNNTCVNVVIFNDGEVLLNAKAEFANPVAQNELSKNQLGKNQLGKNQLGKNQLGKKERNEEKNRIQNHSGTYSKSLAQQKSKQRRRMRSTTKVGLLLLATFYLASK
ncbi:MAG: hypothetical protein GY822_10495 [Deltaproteobacteria bacterium]|nr:hypothetical protein [Deltaproteobacteria bacterium]